MQALLSKFELKFEMIFSATGELTGFFYNCVGLVYITLYIPVHKLHFVRQTT